LLVHIKLGGGRRDAGIDVIAILSSVVGDFDVKWSADAKPLTDKRGIHSSVRPLHLFVRGRNADHRLPVMDKREPEFSALPTTQTILSAAAVRACSALRRLLV
jgi:hypothetical protein